MQHYKRQSFRDVTVNDGFWKKKQDMVAETSIYAIYDRFAETGRFAALDFKWKEGDPNMPHIFWDSDNAKWIESCGYILQKRDDPELVRRCDELIDKMAAAQEPNGYFNVHFQTLEKKRRLFDRSQHELYCLGHLIEAAVAYYYATGKDKLLNVVKKYLDYIERRFMIDQDAAFVTPGHEEIELALIKLYNLTNDEKYLRMSKFFIDQRGNNTKDRYIDNSEDSFFTRHPNYSQMHLPVREQKVAEGHSVRAVYLYSGMADVARETDDETLFDACNALYQNITEKQMYITGGIGSSSWGEAFSCDYDLPNVYAYTESCAAIGLAFFAGRMQLIDNQTTYADTIERIMYNGFLSSISLDGDKFFYENPLEYDRRLFERAAVKAWAQHMPITERQKMFGCSCCPPNITRFLASLGDYMFTYDDSRINVLQYISSETEINGRKITITTDYPRTGSVKISVGAGKAQKIALRIPSWCDKYTSSVKGGKEIGAENNWLIFDVADGEAEITFDMEMKVKYYASNVVVRENCGRVAVARGPIIYCAESADNGLNLRDIKLDVTPSVTEDFCECCNAVKLTVSGTRSKCDGEGLYNVFSAERTPVEVQLIPYYAFSNRENTEMLVWFDHN